MNFGDVLYESKERVATITLNRPERFNAISETMPEDIAKAFGHDWRKESKLNNGSLPVHKVSQKI